MGKVILMLAAVFLAGFMVVPATAKEKLAVMDLDATHGVDASLAVALSDFLRTEIQAQGEYEVIGRQDLEVIAKRTALQQQAGATDDDKWLVSFGQALGSKYMVHGSLSKIGDIYMISLRLLDTEGAQAGVKRRLSERCRCSQDELLNSMHKIAARIMGGEAPDATSGLAAGLEMVPVKGGCFRMGNTFGGGEADEQPVHEVCLDDFQIGKYEVTQGQWQEVMGSNPAHFKSGPDYPVENVSWNDVQEFIRRLNEKNPGGGRGFRLPTEAEWEYACRSGGRDERYCGGGNVEAVAWYNGNGNETTHKVGTKAPNGLGIYDMSGNVWEWVQDWYLYEAGGLFSKGKNYYQDSPRQNPQGPLNGSQRLERGGSWIGHPGQVRAAVRGWDYPGIRLNAVGFRLVLLGEGK
ncbi:MAG: SUMF1/EgtB/PvdO family nonheme iron enzyme [Desulfobulbaceae bacterium]|nr:SUMF1/EgtB/PvdO family nonheme iron enzyme [Desulfobulbaceae bacterium]